MCMGETSLPNGTWTLFIILHLCRHKHLTTVTPASLEAKLYVDHNMAKIYTFVLWVPCITCTVFEFRWLFVLCVLRLQQLESLVWVRSGNSFVSSHSDGGYMVWPVSSSSFCTNEPISSTIPYGEPMLLVFSKLTVINSPLRLCDNFLNSLVFIICTWSTWIVRVLRVVWIWISCFHVGSSPNQM